MHDGASLNSFESTEMTYQELSIDHDLFTANVYKRNYRNPQINQLFRNSPLGADTFIEANRSSLPLESDSQSQLTEKGYEYLPSPDLGYPFFDESSDKASQPSGEETQNMATMSDNPEATVNCVDKHSLQPLHHAAQKGDPVMIAFLIHKGAKLEAKTSQGYTALQLACIGNSSSAVEALLAAGASFSVADFWLDTPWGLSITTRSFDSIRALIPGGVDIDNACAVTGRTALHLLAYDNPDTDGVDIGALSMSSTIIEYLLGLGANVEAQDIDGNRILHYLADHRYFTLPCREIVDLVLKKGADLNATNKQGCSPVHLAARNCNTELLGILLTEGAQNVHLSDIELLEHFLERDHGEKPRAIETIRALLRGSSAERALPMNLNHMY